MTVRVPAAEMARQAQQALAAQANPDKADGMRAYMKTDMPFYGVQKPARVLILRHLTDDFSPADRSEYEDMVLALWELPHREEKYLALGVAREFGQYVVPGSLPLYRRLIVEGAWWDFVDEVATKLLRKLVVEHGEGTWPTIDRWIDADDMWLRRSAILCQIGAKTATDVDRLFRFCAERAFEKEFFIRKAIGWALREYAHVDPEIVARFAAAHRGELSALSYREATKHIQHLL